jgi:hypothetical protein
MPTQLSLYNGALRKIKERKLSSLTENQERRRLLDDAWDGHIKECLEAAMWRFARRTVKLVRDSEYTASFGHTYRFTKPDDFIRTIGVWYDDRCQIPLLDYLEDGGYYYSDLQEPYFAYVSYDEEYGRNMSIWPESFTEFVEWKLASKIVGRLANATVDEAFVEKQLENHELKAKSLSAMEGPSQRQPMGGWSSARVNNFGRRDRGNRGNLIG